MKIKALHISAFGGLKNLELDLDNSFNIIYGENEHGKTTVMTFIKMMFYGTERSSAQLSKNLRKKYTPWDNSVMAGSIDFENNGRLYRLERIFGSSNSTDKVTLIDLGLGTRETVAADIGTSLFGLSSAAFERSIFIGQFGFPESNALASGELNGKLSNIASTGDETVSYDAVNKRLETAKLELMSKSGRSGIYDKNAKMCEALQNELDTSLLAHQTIAKTKETAEQMAEKIKALQEKALALKTKIEAENDVRNAEKLKELLSLKEKLDELNRTLTLSDGKIADELFVRKVEFCLSKIQNIESKIIAKQNENALLESNLKLALNPTADATPEKLEELGEKIENLEKESRQTSAKIAELSALPKAKSSIIWFILAGVFAVLSVPLFIDNLTNILAFASVSLAVVFICIALITSSKAKQKNARTEAEIVDLKLKENQLISIIASEKANFTAINTALNTNSAMIENQKEKLAENNSQIKTLSGEKQTETQTLLSLFSSLKSVNSPEQIKQELDELKKSAEAQKELKQNINYILRDIGNISYEEAKQKLDNLKVDTATNFEKLKTDYDNLLQEITDRKTQLATVLAEIKSLSNNVKNPEALKKELGELKQKTEAQKEYCDCLDIALITLADSYAEVRQSYGSVLEKTASEIFTGLTDGRYSNMAISKSFDITVEKSDVFGSRELDYLSSGTADQAYLSLRLALSHLLTEENGALPIILDDALAQYDDSRTKTALKFLKEYSTNGQIIMFTCHKLIADTASLFDANQITL